MKANRQAGVLLLLWLVAMAFQLSAQESGVARKRFDETRTKAEKGDADAEALMGVLYHDGNGVTKDHSEAAKWYRKAAEKGNTQAQLVVGIYYLTGDGVTKDASEAVKWFRKASEQGSEGGQSMLGSCYATGRGVAKDEVEAVKWFRKAAEQNHASAQFDLGVCYFKGQGVAKDEVEAVKWFRKAAEQNDAKSQYILGGFYATGQGVAKDEVEAVKWFRKAAEQNDAKAQYQMGVYYSSGEGVAKNEAEAVVWFRKAAEQDNVLAQSVLGAYYSNGRGVAEDRVEAYKWELLAAAKGDEEAKAFANTLERVMSREQITEGQKLASNFKPRRKSDSDNLTSPENPTASGTGFFISGDGFLITNAHVATDATHIRLITSAGLISAKVVKVDAANDLALLKADGRFAALPVASSRGTKLGGTVATVGFPNIGLQGFAPKLAKGEIASLSGASDDARYFQISVPVQPGNSGGALVDERGNVVGVVSAKLSAKAALAASGALPENVNYAVKSSFLLGFLESVPDVAAKLKEPNTKEQKFEDVVKSAEQAAVLVLVY